MKNEELNKIRRDKYIKDEKYRQERSEYHKNWYQVNKEEIKIYENTNKEKIKENKKRWRLKNKEKIKSEYNIWRLKNKDKINNNYRTYIKERKLIDSLFKLSLQIRKNILKSFSSKNTSKKSKTKDILGCSFEEFKMYIELKFEPWMNWNNRGLYNGELNYGWDLDHVIPISSAITEDDIIRLNHYTNFQPLCSHTNRNIKRDYILK